MPSNQANYLDAVTVHAIDDGVVVFEKERQSLFVTNGASAPIWRNLGRTRSPQSAAVDLCERSGIEPDHARRQVAEALRSWRHGVAASSSRSMKSSVAHAGEVSEHLPVARKFLQKSSAMAASRRHHLLETAFTIRYATEALEKRVEEALASVSPDARWPRYGAVIDVIPFDDGIALAEGDEVMEFCGAESQIADRVKSFLISRALADSHERIAFQASAVVRDGVGLVLPDVPDSNPNLLAAGLISEGFELTCSGVAVLGSEGSSLYPSPFGLALHEDDLPELSVRIPALDASPRHVRSDGEWVRYMPSHEVAAAPADQQVPMKYLIFPERRDTAGLDVVPISDLSAMSRLLPAQMTAGSALSSADVDRMVDWVGGLRCFALRYSSLTEAVNLLGQLGGYGLGNQPS